jgi:hypothetical protein
MGYRFLQSRVHPRDEGRTEGHFGQDNPAQGTRHDAARSCTTPMHDNLHGTESL